MIFLQHIRRGGAAADLLLHALAEFQQAVHPDSQRQGTVLHKFEGFIAQAVDLHAGVRQEHDVRHIRHRGGDERDGILFFKQQAAGFLAAQANAHLHAVADLLVKPGMLAADLTQGIFAELQNQLAEIVVREERAAVALTQTETGDAFRRLLDLLAQAVAKFALQCFVIFAGVRINIDLPARTAGIAAGRRRAAEPVIKIRFDKFHGMDLRFARGQP